MMPRAAASNYCTKTSNAEPVRPSAPKTKLSTHAAANIPEPALGRFRLCPREDEVYVKIIDIMRPFRLPTVQHGAGESEAEHGPVESKARHGPVESKRPAHIELKGIGAQFEPAGAEDTTTSRKRRRLAKRITAILFMDFYRY
ncbi:hypothetical protein CMUS01_04622 [Colletotrichum musicola]|uniref:Uncharacterized protein n=1 Tax=Colletotrichum musicola TaxID=2175873 RepID=A0A8H6KVK8_9PEZI|nr:hypothetical protein CMUS01_04622 [Colletotrichum musicola]